MEKDYCNLQCFPEKTIKKNLEKKNMKKERKKNLVKKHCSKIKTMWENTMAIDNISKKKTIKLNSQPVQ